MTPTKFDTDIMRLALMRAGLILCKTNSSGSVDPVADLVQAIRDEAQLVYEKGPRPYHTGRGYVRAESAETAKRAEMWEMFRRNPEAPRIIGVDMGRPDGDNSAACIIEYWKDEMRVQHIPVEEFLAEREKYETGNDHMPPESEDTPESEAARRDWDEHPKVGMVSRADVMRAMGWKD